MKNKDKRTAMWTAAICGCLCLLAVGAGVVWQAMDYRQSMPQAPQSQAVESPMYGEELQPVTMAQTPTVDETKLQKEKQNKDSSEKIVTQPTPAPKAAPNTAPVFSYPLQGEIVMPYSVDCAIYDPTLNQYHTSDTLSISAQTGEVVKAAEKGKVKEITKDEEKGNSVVVEHDNGWLTTYSQLADEISVEVGEAVTKGQTVGTVGEPTKYTVALGSHVEFAVEKDGETVDPEKVVQE
ncbi:M23 family metallopeptidase [Anaerotignum sp. MB30-C6]|uniref:M23 family metallopeptidase n=1 Tax=Anaerotignum sp. MB30-C6 TaxID=3070814 RepID=UPI0027DDBB3F|nr:M23 family metallopeptidase [Anaerotignum sp. MB30-C6]WMI81363.1 M23 family metallopeptidase [Anaerotignum sp. MB30-C6]